MVPRTIPTIFLRECARRILKRKYKMASNSAMKTIAITTRDETSVSKGFICIVNMVNYSGGNKLIKYHISEFRCCKNYVV